MDYTNGSGMARVFIQNSEPKTDIGKDQRQVITIQPETEQC